MSAAPAELPIEVEAFLTHLVVEKGRSPLTIAAYRRDLLRYVAFLAERHTAYPDASPTDVDEFAARPGSDVLYGHGLLIDENDTTLRRCWSDRYSLRMAARGLSFIMQPSTFFRRDAFARTGGFNVGNRIAWDAELLLDLALAGASIERVEHLWSAFRIHAEGITGSGAHLGAHAAYLRRAFDRVHGREPGRIDAIAGLPLRLLKHALHPRAAIERWRYGPVAGRPAD